MLWRIAITVTVMLLAASGCGSDNADAVDATSAGQAMGTDHALGESTIKYDALDAMEARGAVAPVIENFTCTWSADTVADCTGTGYDMAADQSSCGYALLPCGTYLVAVHAQCSDPEGHSCEATLELKSD